MFDYILPKSLITGIPIHNYFGEDFFYLDNKKQCLKNYQDIESIVIKNDLYNSLSDDSKEVIAIILNLNKKISIKDIEKLLKDKWGDNYSNVKPKSKKCILCNDNRIEIKKRKVCKKCYYKLHRENKLTMVGDRIKNTFSELKIFVENF